MALDNKALDLILVSKLYFISFYLLSHLAFNLRYFLKGYCCTRVICYYTGSTLSRIRFVRIRFQDGLRLCIYEWRLCMSAICMWDQTNLICRAVQEACEYDI